MRHCALQSLSHIVLDVFMVRVRLLTQRLPGPYEHLTDIILYGLNHHLIESELHEALDLGADRVHIVFRLADLLLRPHLR